MSAIDGKGRFVYLLSALASGDVEALNKQILKRKMTGDNDVVTVIFQKISVLSETGFARVSRKGWKTLEHPDLGMVQWKSGYDFRTTGIYFFLRINGKRVLSCWPEAGKCSTYPKWIMCPEESDLLGCLSRK